MKFAHQVYLPGSEVILNVNVAVLVRSDLSAISSLVAKQM